MRAFRVGLTGGIAAGKSLALREMARRGAVVIDADEIARRQRLPGGAAYKRIIRAFGTADRAALAKVVFRDPAARRKLERITHPLVSAEMSRRLKAAKGAVVVAAVPLLFESSLEKMFDLTVTIEAGEPERLRRAQRRDAASAEQVSARMRAQLSDSARRARADVVIDNNGPKPLFLAKVSSYYRAFELLQRGAAAAQ